MPALLGTYAADNLVKMWGWVDTGGDERIQTLNNKLRAAEPDEGRRRRRKRERSKRLHVHLSVPS